MFVQFLVVCFSFSPGKGGLTFPDTESSYSNLAMLMEQEKFSDDMDPKR